MADHIFVHLYKLLGDGPVEECYTEHPGVAKLLDALQLEAAVIAGGSSGGFTARRFAVDYSERTLGLVLLGSPFTLRDKPGVLALWESTISKVIGRS